MKDKKFIKALFKILNTNAQCSGPANIKGFASRNRDRSKKKNIKEFLKARFYVSEFD